MENGGLQVSSKYVKDYTEDIFVIIEVPGYNSAYLCRRCDNVWDRSRGKEGGILEKR